MQTRILFAALGFGLAAWSQSLLVLNKGDNTLAIVDPATFAVKGRAPSGPDPHEVEASEDGRTAYITNYQRGNGLPNTISVVDVGAGKALAPIDLGALTQPHGLHFAGGKLFFSAEGSKAIGRYDPVSRKIDWVMGTGQDRTHMVIAAPDLKRLFTTNVTAASVSIIEEVERKVGPPPGRTARDWTVTTVPVGEGAEGFDLTPDGRQLWVANARAGSVSIIDVASKKNIATIQVPFRAANRLKFTLDGKLALISDLGGDQIYVVDAATRKLVKSIPAGGGQAGILMDPSGGRAFVSVGRLNSVAVVDLKTLAITGRIEAGPGPDGLAWAPAIK